MVFLIMLVDVLNIVLFSKLAHQVSDSLARKLEELLFFVGFELKCPDKFDDVDLEVRE